MINWKHTDICDKNKQNKQKYLEQWILLWTKNGSGSGCVVVFGKVDSFGATGCWAARRNSDCIIWSFVKSTSHEQPQRSNTITGGRWMGWVVTSLFQNTRPPCGISLASSVYLPWGGWGTVQMISTINRSINRTEQPPFCLWRVLWVESAQAHKSDGRLMTTMPVFLRKCFRFAGGLDLVFPKQFMHSVQNATFCWTSSRRQGGTVPCHFDFKGW